MQFWRSRSDEAVDDFDDFDPTPYSGGYDQALTYGRPLSASDEMCYSISTAGDIDYERPHYSSASQTSAYEAEAYGAYGGRPQRQEYGSEYGLGFGGREEQESGYGYQEEKNRYGEDGYGGSGYRRSEEKPSYGRNEGYGKLGYGGGEYRKNEQFGYGDEEESSGYGRESRYGGEDYGRSNYGIESYDEGEQKQHGHQKKHHHRHNYDED